MESRVQPGDFLMKRTLGVRGNQRQIRVGRSITGRKKITPTKKSLFWRKKLSKAFNLLMKPNVRKKEVRSLIYNKIPKKQIINYFFKGMDKRLTKSTKLTLKGVLLSSKVSAGASSTKLDRSLRRGDMITGGEIIG